jgi:hypothetical protein
VTHFASPATDFYGALGSMIGGIGTVLAFGAAVWVLWWEARKRRLDLEDLRCAQARLVSSDVAMSFDEQRDKGHSEKRSGIVAFHLRVANDSALPIHDAQVFLQLAGEQEPTFVNLGRVEPHSVRTETVDRKEPYVIPGYTTWYTVSVGFMDADGLHWSRTGHEEPVRLWSARTGAVHLKLVRGRTLARQDRKLRKRS